MFYRIIFYSRKFSNSSIKQNSPNVLFTVKKFKLLRLGAPGRICSAWHIVKPHFTSDDILLASLPLPALSRLLRANNSQDCLLSLRSNPAYSFSLASHN